MKAIQNQNRVFQERQIWDRKFQTIFNTEQFSIKVTSFCLQMQQPLTKRLTFITSFLFSLIVGSGITRGLSQRGQNSAEGGPLANNQKKVKK